MEVNLERENKMSSLMRYKGYDASIHYSPKDRIFFGVVEDIADKITFEGESVDELENDFHEAVDDYLEFCQSVGKSPDKPYRGSFNVRISPELHKKACQQARQKEISLNQFVEEAIRAQVESIDHRSSSTWSKENSKIVLFPDKWSSSDDSITDFHNLEPEEM